MRKRGESSILKGSGKKAAIEWSSVGATVKDAQKQKLKPKAAAKQAAINEELKPPAPQTAEETWRKIQERRAMLDTSKNMNFGRNV